MDEFKTVRRRQYRDPTVSYSLDAGDNLHLQDAAGYEAAVQVLSIQADSVDEDELGHHSRSQVALLDDGRWLLLRAKSEGFKLFMFESKHELVRWMWEHVGDTGGSDVWALYQMEMSRPGYAAADGHETGFGRQAGVT